MTKQSVNNWVTKVNYIIINLDTTRKILLQKIIPWEKFVCNGKT